MIVKCIRCNTEFSSSHSQSHVCPNCHFVFSQGDSQAESLEIVRSHDLVRERIGHRLTEEAADKCAFHPDTDAIAHCACCGRPLCYACAMETEQGFYCESCEPTGPPGHEKAERQPPADRRVAPAEEAGTETVSQALRERPYVPWEYRRYIGRLNALFATWRQTLFTPLSFFRGVPITGDYRSPLSYGIFWTLTGLAGGAVWKLLLRVSPLAVAFFQGEPVQLSLQLSTAYLIVTAALLLSPLIALLMLFIACSVYHAFVVLFTRRHAGYEATLRVVCYCTGTNVFYFLPLVGGMLGGVWQLALVTIGLKEVHRISFPLALMIALVPYTTLLIIGFAFMLWAVSGDGVALPPLLGELSRFL